MTSRPAASPADPEAGGAGAPAASRPPVAALAAVATVNVAAIYLAQPLLPFIGDDLDAGAASMSAVHALLQVAFGVGLVIFGLLADIVDRRLLLIGMGAGLTVAAAAATAAPAYPLFLAAATAMGASAAVLPVVVAVAAPGGVRALAIVLSAAPVGVVVGRVVAGLLGAASWRIAFLLAAVAAAALTATIVAVMRPLSPPARGSRPGPAAAAMLRIALSARVAGLNLANAVPFLGWSAVWTMLAFLLREEPYDMNAAQVGLVALVAVGGAVSGQVGARLSATIGEGRGARCAIVVAAVACVALALTAEILWLLMVALFVHNAAIWVLQAVNVPGAARRAGPGMAARGTAVLYLTNFLCTGIGALVGAVVWEAGGWPAVGMLAGACCVVALVLDVAFRPASDEARRGPSPHGSRAVSPP